MNKPFPVSFPFRVDHIGIVVWDINKTAEKYSKAFGVEIEKIENLVNLKIAFLRIGDSWIELLQPLSKDDENYEFLIKHGEGLHHIAFEVEDVSFALEHVKKEGFEVIDNHPRPGANSATIAFLGREYGGALIEILHFDKIEHRKLKG